MYLIGIVAYLTCLKISSSILISISLTLFIFCRDFALYSIKIYPDTFQLLFIFIAIYFLVLDTKLKFYFASFFCGLAFGVKGQGVLIFLYIILFFLVEKFIK